MMKLCRCLLLLTVLVLFCSSPRTAAAATSRVEAFSVFELLQRNPLIASFPEEYRSFYDTFASAEQLFADGTAKEADDVFSFAVLKGNLLLSRIRELEKNQPANPPPRPAVLSIFSTAVKPVPAPARPPVYEPPNTSTPVTQDEQKPEELLSVRIVGEQGVYTARRKESLRLVASRLGVRLRDLAAMNRIKTDATVFAGQKLHYNNRRIIPKRLHNGIVINIPDRSLYLFRNGRVAARYPVAVGIAKKGDSIIWRTPVGKFRIVDKKENPTWKIPPSIQKEMEENGEEVVAEIPPGPKNPLGKYAMRTTLPGIMIHSTTRPASINSYSSHGCIRVMPEHMERLFRDVTVPMQGEIVYAPVKAEVTEDGRVFLEVNNDSYEQLDDLAQEVNRVLKKVQASEKVSWKKVKQVLNEKSGIAVDVSAVPD